MIVQSWKLFRLAFKNEPSNTRNLAYATFLEILSIALLYLLNLCYGSLYDGISQYNISTIYHSMAYFSGLAGILVCVGGFSTYYLNKLSFSLRVGLNTHFFTLLPDLWEVKNLDQRIQEDLRNFGTYSVDFWFAILRSVLKLPIFVGVVVSLTQWWVGLILILSVVLGTIATKVVARKLIELQSIQETNEANYRNSVKSVIKRNFQGILYSFEFIKTNFQLINNQVKKLAFLQSGLGQTFVLLPFFILIPLYLAKTISMGVLMQAANAMGKVIESLTVLIEQRQLIVNISTCLKRMETLE